MRNFLNFSIIWIILFASPALGDVKVNLTCGWIAYDYNTETFHINLDKKESHETDHYQKNIVKYFKDYNFNGKYYRDVFEVIQDTINEPEIIKVPYMLRAIPGGILKFYDSDTKQMWELIN